MKIKLCKKRNEGYGFVIEGGKEVNTGEFKFILEFLTIVAWVNLSNIF